MLSTPSGCGVVTLSSDVMLIISGQLKLGLVKVVTSFSIDAVEAVVDAVGDVVVDHVVDVVVDSVVDVVTLITLGQFEVVEVVAVVVSSPG